MFQGDSSVLAREICQPKISQSPLSDRFTPLEVFVDVSVPRRVFNSPEIRKGVSVSGVE